MKKIPDSILLSLFVVALIVTLTGMTLSIEKFFGISLTGDLLTGAFSDTTATGQVNISINAVTSLSNRNAKISFGGGRVNSTCDYCIMDSNFINISYFSSGTKSVGALPFHGASAAAGSCCLSFSGNQSGFLIENTGNVNISVGYQCSGNCTFETFVGGSRNINGFQSYGLDIKVTPNVLAGQSGESGSTDTLFSCRSGGYYLLTGWNISNASDWGLPTANGGNGNRSGAGVGNSSNAGTDESGGNFYIPLGGVYMNGANPGNGNNVSAGGHWLCGNRTHYPLSSVNTEDAAVIDINVTVPSDAPISGSAGSILTITFNGTSGYNS